MNQGLGSNGFPLRRFSGSMFNLPGCHQVQSQHLKHQDLKPRLHEIASCLAPFQASASIYMCTQNVQQYLLMVQKSGVHQLRLVVYPIICRVLCIPGGAGFLPSTVPPVVTFHV